MKRLLCEGAGTLVLIFCFFASSVSAGEVNIHTPSGERTILYRSSHALVIGAADYASNSWNDLPRVINEVEDVASVLRDHGFIVETVLNPTGPELRDAVRRFVVRHGSTRSNADNRLLIFFSGHGHTRASDRGYLVPIDAPDPVLDEAGFLETALDMVDVVAWARKIEAKHALFVFDSCFSGTLFETRARPNPGEAYIKASTGKPVRQFITAGDAGQEVPAASIFTPLFIEALEGRADMNNDDYVTGVELGLFLMQTVPDYDPGQTPQYGKIRDVRLDDGDFVFRSGAGRALPPLAVGNLREEANETRAADTPKAIEQALGLNRAQQRAIQLALNERGYDAGSADGIFGPRTRAAVRSWQSAAGYEASGYLNQEQIARIAPLTVSTERFDGAYESGDRPSSLQSQEPEVDAPATAERFKDCERCPEMVVIPSGSFVMDWDGVGVSERSITFKDPFAIGRYEVTQREWDACVAAGGCPAVKTRTPLPGDMPVVNVSWNDANAYTRWLSKASGESYRLPTEAEWQYSARAGTTTTWSTGEQITTAQANYNDNTPNHDLHAMPVGRFPPNRLGLFDTSGNVAEWVADLFAPEFSTTERIIKGGSWSLPRGYMRPAHRWPEEEDFKRDDVGFRVARDL